MRVIFIAVLVLVVFPGVAPWAAGQQDDGSAELASTRALILKNDYRGAQLGATTYCLKIAAILRNSPRPSAPPKNLLSAPGATVNERLLSMLDQVAQMQSSGDLWSAMKYADTLRLALGDEIRRSRPTPAQRQEQVEQLIQSSTGTRRMMALSLFAKAAFEAGDFEKARNYSSESLRLADPSKSTWRQADAVYLAHIIAGRLALRSQDLDGARRHLTESIAPMSSAPSVAAMGPDIPFAAELVAAGEKDAVITYLAECAKWLKADEGKTAQWSEMIRQGKQPWAEWIQLHPPAW
jgi:hypothetical protein